VRDKPGVRAFKFVQAPDLSVDLQLAGGPELTQQVEQAILSSLARRLGADTPVRISRVESIAPERSGKHRYVISHAPSGRASVAG